MRKKPQAAPFSVARRSPRIVGPFNARWRGAVAVPLVIHDISVGGCMILSSSETPPTNLLTLEIDLSDHECITLQAELLYVRPQVGFAVRFVNLSKAAEMSLQRFVSNATKSRA